MRNTIQKQTILKHLMAVKSHPTAEQAYVMVRKDIPTISLATVYRVLNTLAAQGIILRFEIDNEYHYDATITPHPHFVCKSCLRIIDLPDKQVCTNIMKNKCYKGLMVESVHVTLFGICDICLKSMKLTGLKIPVGKSRKK